MKKIIRLKSYWPLLVLIIAFIGCKPTIALYDRYAYTQATSLKVDLQNLALESDTVSYSNAKGDIDKTNVNLQKAYEYNKGRNFNSLSTKQYEILLSEDHFYKGFLKDWKQKGKENSTMANNISKQIGDLMDQIIKLENGKNK